MPEPEESPEALLALAREALTHWDLEGAELSLHARQENVVFRVESSDGNEYALRIHRDGYHDRSALEAEHLWTSELARSGLPVPEAIPTRDGEAYAVVAFPASSATRHVGLVRWISGILLSQTLGKAGDSSRLARSFAQLGKITADFHGTSSKWTPPAGFRRHARDAEGLAGEHPFWGRFWEIQSATDEQRTRLVDLRDTLLEKFSDLDQNPEVYGMIHADMHSDNVLVDGGRLTVIDFDDAGFGWYMYDVAAVLYSEMDTFHPENPHFEVAQNAFIQGYRERRKLPSEEVKLIPWFMLARSLELTKWAEDRPEARYEEMIPLFLEVAFELAETLRIE
jgi:Ser/Thr protein kinase RdoA (MazF antagonist)